MKTKKVAASTARTLALLVILAFLLFPLIWMLLTSFKTNMEAYSYPPTFLPKSPSFQAYVNLFTKNNDFFVYYKNNVVISAVTAAITTLLALFAGYALSRFRFRWNKWVVAALLSSQMFPIISRMISLYSLMGKMHLINTHAGLTLALVAAMLPFCTMLMSSFFDGVPLAVEEAARVDGAGRMGILFRIVIPLVSSGIVAVGIYACLMTWDDYLHAATLLQTDSLRTLSVGIALRYLGELSYDWSLINTISVVGMLPMVCIFFFFQKYMVKGLVAGAVKG